MSYELRESTTIRKGNIRHRHSIVLVRATTFHFGRRRDVVTTFTMPKSPGKKRTRKSQDADEIDDDDSDFPMEKSSKDVDDADKEDNVVPSTKKELSQSSILRDMRRKRRSELRTKTTGTGLKIDRDGEKLSSNKRVVFDDMDDDVVDDGEPISIETEDDVAEKPERKVVEQKEEEEEDDDDDKVEEVQSNVAKTLAMKERAKERASELLTNQIKGNRKKKRSTKGDRVVSSKPTNDDDEDDNDLDPSFFAQVDAQLAEQRKQKREEKRRQAQTPLKPKGRHTTFVSSEDDVVKKPIPVDQTIELVVLGNRESAAVASNPALLACPLSQTAQKYAKGQLITDTSGTDISAKKKKQQQKMGNKKNATVVSAWKRAKKMNDFAVPGAKSRKARLHGKAAAQFVVK